MADSFYARWTDRYDADNQTAWDDIVLQFDLIEDHTRNETTGLLAHGYDESKVAVWADPITGSAPLVWSRAVGWYFLSLLEVLEVFPQSHPGYERLLEYYTWLAEALKASQDSESGGWWLIMSEQYVGAEGNYIESSGMAMFTYGWFKGIRDGHLQEDEYLGPAKKAYEGMTSQFLEPEDDGTVTWHGTVEVGSLSSNGTYEVRLLVCIVSSRWSFEANSSFSITSGSLWFQTTSRELGHLCWLPTNGKVGRRRPLLK